MIRLPFRLEQPHGTIRGDIRIPDGPPSRPAIVTFKMTGSGIGADPHAFTVMGEPRRHLRIHLSPD